MPKAEAERKAYETPEYEQCPFCDKIFEVAAIQFVTLSPYRTTLEKHIVEQHKKVKVRKGSNYKWMDEAEVKRALSASSLSEVMR